jgi:hypothetical protein
VNLPTLKSTGERLHFALTFLLAAAIIPALHFSRLPIKFDWLSLLKTYWVAFAFQSIFAAIALYVVGFPIAETLAPLWLRYNQDRRRLLLLAPFLLFLLLLYTHFSSLAVLPFMVVVAVGLLELFDRTQDRAGFLSERLSAALIPALYLFVGLVLVSAYNDVAVASRPYVSYDAFFERLDSRILAGATVRGIAHYAVHSLPLKAYILLEFIYYYCMFPQMGAALLLIAFHHGRKETFRFVGTLLTAYYLTIALFWMWPSQGPFFLCREHFAQFPDSLRTYAIQSRLLSQASWLWAGKGFGGVSLDYYIAFPSMHIAAPLIVAWFLRRWKKILGFLLAIDLIIAIAVVLLEWHYVVDMLGGVAVAALSILVVGGVSKGREPTSSVLPGRRSGVTKSLDATRRNVNKGERYSSSLASADEEAPGNPNNLFIYSTIHYSAYGSQLVHDMQ